MLKTMKNMRNEFKLEAVVGLAQQLKEFADGRRRNANGLGEEMKAKFIGQAEGYESAAKWLEEILK